MNVTLVRPHHFNVRPLPWEWMLTVALGKDLKDEHGTGGTSNEVLKGWTFEQGHVEFFEEINMCFTIENVTNLFKLLSV